MAPAVVAGLRLRHGLATAALLLAAGCTQRPQPDLAEPAPIRAAPGSWVVSESTLRIRVHPDGPLARLGHSHVIHSTALTGVIEPREPLTATDFTLVLPLASLNVDDPQQRAQAGPEFTAPVPDDARAGTLRNLLGPALLDAGRRPLLVLRSAGASGGPQEFMVRVAVELRGAVHTVSVPVHVDHGGDRLTASGRFVLSHRDLGLTPFAVGLGALRVADTIDIEFRIAARRGAPA